VCVSASRRVSRHRRHRGIDGRSNVLADYRIAISTDGRDESSSRVCSERIDRSMAVTEHSLLKRSCLLDMES
jgi:hypothetical protein